MSIRNTLSLCVGIKLRRSGKLPLLHRLLTSYLLGSVVSLAMVIVVTPASSIPLIFVLFMDRLGR